MEEGKCWRKKRATSLAKKEGNELFSLFLFSVPIIPEFLYTIRHQYDKTASASLASAAMEPTTTPLPWYEEPPPFYPDESDVSAEAAEDDDDDGAGSGDYMTTSAEQDTTTSEETTTTMDPKRLAR